MSQSTTLTVSLPLMPPCERGQLVVQAKITEDKHEVLWLDADKKGASTHLDNGFRSLLRGLGAFDEDELEAAEPCCHDGPFKQPLMWFDFVEFCGGAGKVTDYVSSFGFSCAPVIDLSESRHYNLASLDFLDWAIWMIQEGRIRSFFVEPPCTTFSPAAHPAVRSYREPLGFNRLDPKTWTGNILALRALTLLLVGYHCDRPYGLEQSRLSKMAWLSAWKFLLTLDFAEAVIASCQFKSIHRKEFRVICRGLDTTFLDVRCKGGHTHVKIEGAYTKPSAIYTDGVAYHIASGLRTALNEIDAKDLLTPAVDGQESVPANDVMLSSKWELVRCWFWKRSSHINLLEASSAVSSLVSVSKRASSVRFCQLIDSAVCRGAFSKGRSPSRALQPLLKKAGAVCITSDLYPAWLYSPTRLNVADDPTRDAPIREPTDLSLDGRVPLGLLRKLSLTGLRRFAANWVRLAAFVQPSIAGLHVGIRSQKDSFSVSDASWTSLLNVLQGAFGFLPRLVSACLSLGFWQGVNIPSWVSSWTSLCEKLCANGFLPRPVCLTWCLSWTSRRDKLCASGFLPRSGCLTWSVSWSLFPEQLLVTDCFSVLRICCAWLFVLAFVLLCVGLLFNPQSNSQTLLVRRRTVVAMVFVSLLVTAETAPHWATDES